MKSSSNERREEERPEIKIDRELCKGCGICVAFCPKGVLELDEEEKAVAVHPDQCNACGLCELRCPDIAIELEHDGLQESPDKHKTAAAD